jgi:hypothetical protein
MPKKLRPAVDLMAFKCCTLNVNVIPISSSVTFTNQLKRTGHDQPASGGKPHNTGDHHVDPQPYYEPSCALGRKQVNKQSNVL